jgi:polyhydroxyalkanoate synthesis regulator protein
MIGQTPILIKRYAGERLYDTVAARYVTIGDIRAMAQDGVPVIVREASDGTDITDALISSATRH